MSESFTVSGVCWWLDSAGVRRAVGAWTWLILLILAVVLDAQKVQLPNFADLKINYPGYFHHGGHYRNHEVRHLLGLKDTNNMLIHDTSALRLSYSLNKIGGVHSLGTQLIQLSKFGHDSIEGYDHLQHIFLPISYGPYLADKYGYPNISKLHQQDPVKTKHNFWGKQGILRVITYTLHGNLPKGHVALWDCNHFHQSKDWTAGNSLLTVEFWESPDSECSNEATAASSQTGSDAYPALNIHQSKLWTARKSDHPASMRIKYLKQHLLPKNARHKSRKMRNRRT